MTDHAGTVVVGIDGSGDSAQALAWGAQQARLEQRTLTLLLTMHPTTPAWLDPTADNPREGHKLALHAQGREIMERVRSEASELLAGVEVQPMIVAGDPREVLLEVSAKAELLVLGSRGLGPLRSMLLGSTSASVVRRAECPVVVHRPTLAGARRGVAVGIDMRPDSLPVLEFAFRMAMLRGEPLSVVHARPPSEAAVPASPEDEASWSENGDAHVATWIAELDEKYPEVDVETVLGHGRPERVLLKLADSAALLVVGVHQHGRIAELTFGTTAVWMVEHAKCPVAAVPLTASVPD